MITLSNLKTITLVCLIGVGLLVQGSRAHATGSETLTVAGGCFWCVEADFEGVEGVTNAVSGYTGGTTTDPTYKQVTGGDTGHYEAVQITFDPEVISARGLLDMFFRSVDPTDAGGQLVTATAPRSLQRPIKSRQQRMPSKTHRPNWVKIL